MFLGVATFGPPELSLGKNTNTVMVVLKGEKKYFIRVRNGWTYHQFNEVENDKT